LRKRYLLRHWRAQRNHQPLVYLDETGFAPSTHRHHGWAPKGQRVRGLQSGQQRPRTSLIGAYQQRRLLAPMLFEGTCNTQVFNQWLEHMLLPELTAGSVIVLDNATFHTSRRTQELVEQAGCELLFLAPYSPDLNPIEKLWANLKRRWRARGGSLDALIRESDY
jgi:transposase